MIFLEFIPFWTMPFFWYKCVRRHKVYRRRLSMNCSCHCDDFIEAVGIHAKQRTAADSDDYARRQGQDIDYYMLHYRIMYTRLMSDPKTQQRYKDEFVAALTKDKPFCDKCAQYNFHETDVQFCFHDSEAGSTHCEICQRQGQRQGQNGEK